MEALELQQQKQRFQEVFEYFGNNTGAYEHQDFAVKNYLNYLVWFKRWIGARDHLVMLKDGYVAQIPQCEDKDLIDLLSKINLIEDRLDKTEKELYKEQYSFAALFYEHLKKAGLTK